MMIKKARRGFTLIEMMIVFAIIGFIVVLTLAGLNLYKERAKDVRIEGAIAQARIVAIMVYDFQARHSYQELCSANKSLNEEHSDPSLASYLSAIENDIKGISGKKTFCYANVENYCVDAELVSSQEHYCADSSGFVGRTAKRECKTGNISCIKI